MSEKNPFFIEATDFDFDSFGGIGGNSRPVTISKTTSWQKTDDFINDFADTIAEPLTEKPILEEPIEIKKEISPEPELVKPSEISNDVLNNLLEVKEDVKEIRKMLKAIFING